MAVTVETLPTARIHAAIDALAALRIAVFREWPYLYDGDLDYERGYLAEFAAAPDAVLVIAREGDTIVGAATASPLAAQKEEFLSPFMAHDWDVGRTFYFGESVLVAAPSRASDVGGALTSTKSSVSCDCTAPLPVHSRPAT